MPGGWNGSGVFTRYYGTNTWQNDAAAGTLILADRHDNNDQGLATGINACLTKNGENTFSGTSGAFRPTNDGGANLGSTTKRWDSAYFRTSVVFQGSTYSTSITPPTQTANTTLVLPAISGTLVPAGVTLADKVATAGVVVPLVASGMDPALTQIDIYLDAVSLNGTNNILIQMLDTSAPVTSGYLTRSSRVFNAAATSSASSTAGFIILAEAAANIVYGMVTLTKMPSGGGIYDDWVITGSLMQSTGSANIIVGGRGVLTASHLDGLQITSTAGDAFDGGGVVSVIGRYA